jgi:hypothetical protein
MNEDLVQMIIDECGILSTWKEGVRISALLEDLKTLSKTYHILCENACNYKLHPRDKNYMIELEDNAKLLIGKVHKGLKLYINTDPRGYPFGIIFPSGRSNNMGGEDWRLDIEK